MFLLQEKIHGVERDAGGDQGGVPAILGEWCDGAGGVDEVHGGSARR